MRKICLIFLFIPIILIAQQIENNKYIDSLLVELPKMKDDSLKVNLLNEIASDYIKNDSLKCLEYIKKAKLLSSKINFKLGVVDSYRILGKFYHQNFNTTRSLYNYNLAIKVCLKAKDQKRLARLYNSLGNVYNDLNNYPVALDNYFKAVKINEQKKLKNNLASNYSNISQIYKGLDDNKKSKKYLNLSSKYALESVDEPLLHYNYITYAQIFEKEKNYSQAAVYAQKAYDLSIKIDDDSRIASSLFAIGLIQARQKKLDLALKNIIKALKKFIEIENEIGTASAYNELGFCYFKKYELEENRLFLKLSKENYVKSNKVYKENDLIDGLSDNYFQLSKIYELENNTKQALTNFKLYTKYKDSIFNGTTKETIRNLEDRRDIELRDKQILINKISLQAKEKQKWFLISGIILLGIIGGLLFYQNKNRQKTNKKLQNLNNNLDQANKIKLQFLNILNHDLKSPVNSFIHFIQFQKENPQLLNDATRSRIENDTIASAKNLLYSMEDILMWSKNQMENFKPIFSTTAIQSVFYDTKNHFAAEENVIILFENPENLEILTDENYLKTIIRNLTGNAIKALINTENPTIIWKAFQDKKHFFLSITDNGKGANQESFKALFDDTEAVGIKSGLGLHLIRDLAKAIDCEIAVDSKVGIGTTFILKLQN